MLSVSVASAFPAVPDTRAEQYMEFSYAGNYEQATSLDKASAGQIIYQAFQMLPMDLEAFDGSKISAITIYAGTDGRNGTNPLRDITLFISEGLGKEPVYTQAAQLASKAFGKNTIELDTPYELSKDKEVYVGYSFTLTDKIKYYIVVDNLKVDTPSGLVATGAANGTIPAANQWSNTAPTLGSICMGVTLAGQNFPENFGSCLGIQAPTCVGTGKPYQIEFKLKNVGRKAISDIALTVEATGEATYTREYKLDTPLASCKMTTLKLDMTPFATDGVKNLKVSIAKVNGNDNDAKGLPGEGYTVSVSKGYQRMPVVEEGTGTWCQYCPGGIVMLEHLKEKYSDKVALIAVHQGDAMAVPGYQSFLQRYASGLPHVVLNRMDGINPNAGEDAFDSSIDECLSNPMFVNAELGDFRANADNSIATFQGKVRFIIDSDKRYNVSLVLLQDGMGPFRQTNGFSGNPNAPGDWGDKPKSVEMLYDDVARDISGFPGQRISESNIVKDTDYDVTFTMNSYGNVTSEGFNAVMLVTDAETGEVLNATLKRYDKASGVDNISVANSVNIATAPGCITVTGASDVNIYTVSGVRIASESISGLPAGIYIVKADNIIRKIFVQ